MTQATTLPPLQAPPLWKAYLAILAPMMLTNTLQAAAGTIDGIYLGQMIGLEAIAAVSAFFPVFFFLLAIIIGLSVGATVLAGQAWGARNPTRARAVAGTALALVLAVGLIVSVIGGLTAPMLLKALDTPPEILDDAVRYARVMLVGAPLIFLLWLATSISRGVGDAVSPMWALILATGVALLCTPALIAGWAGLPRLDVLSPAASRCSASRWRWAGWRGAGAAGAIPGAQCCLLRELRFDPTLTRSILKIGVPAALQMLTMAAAEIALLGLVNRHGAQATAAYGAVTQLMSWLQLPAMSLGISATILAAHAIGAGRGHRLGAIARTGLMMNVAVTGLFVCAAYALAPYAIGLFLKDGAAAAQAGELLRIVAWSVVALGCASVLSGVMRASGTVLVPATLGVLAIVGVELPAAWWLDARIGLSGIWWAYALAFMAMLVLQSGYFMLGWRGRTPQRLV